VPSGWGPSTVSTGETLEIELAKYGMLLADSSKAITWAVPTKIYFHGLYCKKSDKGKLIWKWQENDAKCVNAGEDGTDTNKLEANYHDREGNNL
ncbi:MAG: hypothetical protein II220_10350, partial [Spirochaetales bacterium]|nr:hypothetical protein [Spirochaetales bacterium]